MALRKGEPIKFGVYQQKTGSYTLGETRYAPLVATPVSEEDAKLACPETSPVIFFDTKEAADANVAKLRAKFYPPKVVKENGQ